MYCQQCGAEMRDNAKFCGKCGTAMANTQSTVVTPPVINDVPRLRKTLSRKTMTLGLVLLVVLVGGGFVGWLMVFQPKLGDTRINPKDGAEMVWVPTGTFTMGPTQSQLGKEQPAHKVTLSGYWMYKYEVTVAQYRTFCAATGRQMPDKTPFDYDYTFTGWDDQALQQHPIYCVSWDDANAYANWAGVSLPSEAQWEYAARSAKGFLFPWGGTRVPGQMIKYDHTKCANHENSHKQRINSWPVGSFPMDKSWCGVMDLAGNAMEWCADWYGPYTKAGLRNPTGPKTGTVRVIRGGSSGLVIMFSVSTIRFEGEQGVPIGFRCVSMQ